MARRSREDEPGSWHHVTNRALARRSFFEARADIRMFLSGVARAMRRGQIEVHAWCVLTTHFRSRAGWPGWSSTTAPGPSLRAASRGGSSWPNLAGSVAFQLSALDSFVRPGAPDPHEPWLAGFYTTVGGIGFLAGSYLLIPELFDGEVSTG